MAQLWVVEDDDMIRGALASRLEAEGHRVRAFPDGSSVPVHGPEAPDLVLLDLGLPDVDGTEVCRRLRLHHPDVVVVVVTARADEMDVVVALEAGADDYLTKPLRFTELAARVGAHLRRAGAGSGARIVLGDLAVDLAARRVSRAGREVALRAKEFDLLARLAAEPGVVVTRETLMSDVWDEHWSGSTKTLDVHIAALRRKLGAGPVIATVRGHGYRLERNDVRARIVRFAVVVSMVAITVFGLPLAVGAARYYVVDEQSDLDGDAQAAADGIAPVLAAGAVPTGVSPVSADSPAAVYGLDGRRVTGDGPDRLEPALAGALTGRVVRTRAGDEFVVAVPVLDGDRRVGVLRASRERAESVERTAVTWAVMLVLGVTAVAGTRLVAGRLANGLSAPLEVLATDAARLGDGDFTVSRPPAGAVAEIGAVHHSLARTAGRLHDLLARERAFSAEASHQLRTPLAGLRLRLEEAAAADPGSVGLADALEAADRLDRIVTELLALSREPVGAARTELDVAGLADRVVAEVRADGLPEGRTLAVVVEAGVRALASEAAVRQILVVLLENAVAHGTGAVTVTVREAGPAVAVDVADEGSLPDDGSVIAGGHGIGLVLARRLAEAQGGRLRVRSTSPTTITVLLPGAPD